MFVYRVFENIYFEKQFVTSVGLNQHINIVNQMGQKDQMECKLMVQ